MNMYEKIYSSHTLKEINNKESLIYIDLQLLHEINTPTAFDGLRRRGIKVRRTKQNIATQDHNTPTRSIDSIKTDKKRNHQLCLLEDNCKEFSIKLNKLGDDDQGITHIIAPEQGLVIPGMIIVCCDSHTSTMGALGTLSFGIGATQVENVLATQTLIYPKFKSMKIEVINELLENITAKDLIMFLINKYGTVFGRGYVIEYTGSVIENLSIEQRMTLCNMTLELGASAGIIGVDDKTIEYLNNTCLKEIITPETISKWKQYNSDNDSDYDAVYIINANDVDERISWGINPSQNISINQNVPNADSQSSNIEIEAINEALDYMGLSKSVKINTVPIDHVFIGSCTNGRIEDLREVADILKGRKVSPNVKMIIVPGSMKIRNKAIEEGLDIIFEESNADFRALSGCALCVGLNEDILPPFSRCVSTSNRNFRHRQGYNVRTHLASPRVAAASAILGRIGSPNELDKKIEGYGIPLPLSNVDTDQIMPAEFCYNTSKNGHENSVFGLLRKDKDFILNNPKYNTGNILIAQEAFGTGSSREFAVWGLKDYGIECVVAASFGDIFYKNAVINKLLPVILPMTIIYKITDLVLDKHFIEIDIHRQVLKIKESSFRFSIDRF